MIDNTSSEIQTTRRIWPREMLGNDWWRSRGIRTTLVWSKPLSTSISPQTLTSFPLTFFFGIIFKATSFVTPLRVLCAESCEGERERRRSEEARDLEGFRVGRGYSSPTAPRSAVASWLTGTCHVARYTKVEGRCRRRNVNRCSNNTLINGLP